MPRCRFLGGAFMEMIAKTTDHPITSAAPSPVKLSVNVSGEVGKRLRQTAYAERVSESSIVQIALRLMFEQTTEESVGAFLREQGASLRRA